MAERERPQALWFDDEIVAMMATRRSQCARKTRGMCKYWSTRTCALGDRCEYRHVYDEREVELCTYFSFGECKKSECAFRHSAPTAADVSHQECKWYAQGFCQKGPACNKRHTPRIACPAYMFGMCWDGPRCHLAHPPMPLDANLKTMWERALAMFSAKFVATENSQSLV